MHSGTDVDCVSFVPSHAMAALNQSKITVADIDARLAMLLRVRFRLSHFDPIGPLDNIPASTICSDYAQKLSHDGPRQAATLLKNDARTLPLSLATVGQVAVIGPNANLSRDDAGYYGPNNVCGNDFWTLVDALAEDGAVRVSSVLGVPDVQSEDQSGIAAAVAVAKAVETVVLAVGTDLNWAAEGHDAKNISFTDAQLALIAQVSAAAAKPVIVVVMTATPLDLSPLLSNPKVGAILHVGQPSLTIIGVADLLYGRASPAGRMVQTVYPAAYQEQISIFDFGMRPGPSPWARPDCTNTNASACERGTNPGRTYRFYTGTAVVPFGFGLSYTTFQYSPLTAAQRTISLAHARAVIATRAALGHPFVRHEELRAAETAVNWATEAAFSVNVTNTGSMDADEAVLGFVVPPSAGEGGVPLKSLFGFERVHVRRGETVTVTLYPSLSDFMAVDAAGAYVLLDTKWMWQHGFPLF
jgi:hypothetical protein